MTGKATCEHWTEHWPELETRPELVAYLKTDAAMRGTFFSGAQRMIELSHRLRGCAPGVEAVCMFYRRYRAILCRVEKRMPENLQRAELQGAFRNIWLNCQRILGFGEPHYRPLDVEYVRESWGSARTKTRLEAKVEELKAALAAPSPSPAEAMERAAKECDLQADKLAECAFVSGYTGALECAAAIRRLIPAPSTARTGGE